MEQGYIIGSESYRHLLHVQLYDYYLNKMFVDVKIACDGAEMEGHSLVIAAGSKYFERELAVRPGQIYLPGIIPDVLSIIIQFLYLGKCVIPEAHVDAVLNAARRYGIKELKTLTKEVVLAAELEINNETPEDTEYCLIFEDKDAAFDQNLSVIVEENSHEDTIAAEFLVGELANNQQSEPVLEEHSMQDRDSYNFQQLNDISLITHIDESTLDAVDFEYPVSDEADFDA